MLLIAVGVAALGYTIVNALDMGTCVSGGPFESARECPGEGGFTEFGLPIMVATFGIMGGVFLLVGSGLARAFGSSGDEDPRVHAEARSIAPGSQDASAPTAFTPPSAQNLGEATAIPRPPASDDDSSGAPGDYTSDPQNLNPLDGD